MEENLDKVVEKIRTWARGIEIKLDFFLTALSFAIVGLGIETAKFGINLAIDIFEMLAWLFLFFSGLIGLKLIDTTIKMLDTMRTETELRDNDEKKKEHKEQVEKFWKIVHWNMKFIKYRNRLFIIGIILIAISRMSLPLKNIICRLC